MSIVFNIIDNTIAHIVIDRPERHNSLDVEHDEALASAWRRYNGDPQLKVAILSGAGGRAFCTGADIGDYLPYRRQLAASDTPTSVISFGGMTGANDISKPTIAAIDGFCVAGGLELALACDIRIATPESRFGLPEVRLGILPGGGGTQRLAKVAGLGVALRMILTGDTFDADFALDHGLVTELVSRDALEPAALAIARQIARNGPLAVAAARRAVLASYGAGLEATLLDESALQRQLLMTRDSHEGIAAFSERRAAAYTGI
ncbi:enoyl-CoA hydratase/isomerase family protein [Cupriavidus oxalaticus]|jgi:enoyl-CoA hydratase/carnithine racemase|uniref:Enoyl-CoA hydratase/isomerase family protein n=1 Tax=Cupriavidus oxalaticus TaxID=96344 RepID=A0A5P3VKW8_9BURK|nr:enoyl-CoA hydratase/isomerase family protein [Cupriavidus oxalaticus]QEZ46608.1 enoyl-CoA hydratase/isomerase family protein [Cupriavidus oxalaticus]